MVLRNTEKGKGKSGMQGLAIYYPRNTKLSRILNKKLSRILNKITMKCLFEILNFVKNVYELGWLISF